MVSTLHQGGGHGLPMQRSRAERSGAAHAATHSLYPFDAATKARPMPVFPEVGSTRVVTPAGRD